MHTEQSNSVKKENTSGQTVLDPNNKKQVLSALNVPNNFATVNFDAYFNTKMNYAVNRDFFSITVQELNTLHTVCESERNQLLTILAMPVRNPHFAGFLLTGNRSNRL